MNIGERRDAIFKYVLAKNLVSISELMEKFSISMITVHRDLDFLEQDGYIRKVRGGATINSSGAFEKSLLFRATQNIDDKKIIAAYAARFIQDGMSLLFDNSTTVLQILPYLIRHKNITVITYFEDIIFELSKPIYDCKLISLGGDFWRAHRCFVGPFVDDRLAKIKVDAAFISAAGLIPEFGLMQQYADECKRKQLIIAASDETNLLIDSSKIMKKAVFTIGPLSQIKRIITNPPIAASIITQIKDTGTDFHLTDPV